MEIKWLKTFCEVYQTKSFTLTAKKLFLTQPAVSIQISQLEKYLGLTLFKRGSRKVVPTKAGEILYPYAIKIVNELDKVNNFLKEFKNLESGNLKIAASTVPGEYLLPVYIKKFKEKYPFISVNVEIFDSFKVFELIEMNEVELGFVGTKVDDKHLVFQTLWSDEIVLAGKKKIDDIDIRKIPLIIREEGSGTIFTVKNYLKRYKILLGKLNIIAKVSSLNGIKEYLKKGIGYAFISKIAIKEELEEKKLVEIPIKDLTPIKRNFYVCYLKNAIFSPSSKEFLNFIKNVKL